ncbi:hypothetical protein ACHQM5_028533 [Ranunculus cassubicifolius]
MAKYTPATFYFVVLLVVFASVQTTPVVEAKTCTTTWTPFTVATCVISCPQLHPGGTGTMIDDKSGNGAKSCLCTYPC